MTRIELDIELAAHYDGQEEYECRCCCCTGTCSEDEDQCNPPAPEVG